VLLMDEPTNHLDIASREAVEAALAQFDGTVFCVSHDRYFLDRVVKRLLILDPPGIIDFPGDYSKWLGKTEHDEDERQRKAEEARAKPVLEKPKTASKKDNPYMRPFGRLTLAELEKSIQETEAALAKCQASFSDPDVFKDATRGQKLQADFEALGKKLRELEKEYFARGQ
jgi:ATP-binding cassette subfamily F protein 3